MTFSEIGKIATVQQTPDGCFIDCEELEIFAFGVNDFAAVVDFNEQLAATLDGLKNEPDSNLTPDAQSLKSKIQKYAGA